jgi:hypothetical protein
MHTLFLKLWYNRNLNCKPKSWTPKKKYKKCRSCTKPDTSLCEFAVAAQCPCENDFLCGAERGLCSCRSEVSCFCVRTTEETQYCGFGNELRSDARNCTTSADCPAGRLCMRNTCFDAPVCVLPCPNPESTSMPLGPNGDCAGTVVRCRT